ncbi:copper resistance CopC family protein [Pseudonocardia nematodicida]|uniref:Copper resistance CopC family protein n=1 Tax=Pseudonocardia nematodicida TaxID=1206997 RepID=A0ABV1KB89_9PSEU
MNSHHPLVTTARRIVVVLLAGTVALLLGAAPAWAHTELESSSPAEGAQLAQAPPEVTLTFNEDVAADTATVTVTGPDGADAVAGPATAEAGTLTVPLRPLGPAGDYTVDYRVISDDGHPVEGTVPFTLTSPGAAAAPDAPATPAAPAQAPTEQAATTPDDGGAPVWPWILGAVVVVGGGAALALRRGRA